MRVRTHNDNLYDHVDDGRRHYYHTIRYYNTRTNEHTHTSNLYSRTHVHIVITIVFFFYSNVTERLDTTGERNTRLD